MKTFKTFITEAVKPHAVGTHVKFQTSEGEGRGTISTHKKDSSGNHSYGIKVNGRVNGELYHASHKTVKKYDPDTEPEHV